jgi:uncharacterized coiled-coil DUF342 family protein
VRDKARNDVLREQTAVKNKLRELNNAKNKLFDQKKAIRDKVRQIQEGKKAREEQIRDARQALKLKKVADSLDANLKQVDDDVAKLELAMETQTLSIREEKDRLTQIAALRKTKDEIRAYHALVDSLSGDADNKAYADQIRTLDTDINSFKGAEQELQKQLDKLRAKLDSKELDAPALVGQRRSLHADLDAAHQAQTNARAALQKLRRDLYNQRQAARAARDAENKAYFEEKKAADRKRAEEREHAELMVVPLADEIALCDSLIKYLAPYRQRALQADAPAAAAATAAAPSAAAGRAADAEAAIKKMAADLGEGVTVLQSSKRPAAAAGGGAKKAEKRAAIAARQTTINHNLHTFADFSKLGLLPPGDITGADESIKQLQAKKAEFQKQSTEKMAARAAAIAAKKAAAAAAEASGAAAAAAAPAAADAAAPAAGAAPAAAAGTIEGDEDGELLAAFKAADKDNSGFLDTTEFSNVLAKLAQFDTPAKVAAAVEKADANKSGRISYREFVKFAAEE